MPGLREEAAAIINRAHYTASRNMTRTAHARDAAFVHTARWMEGDLRDGDATPSSLPPFFLWKLGVSNLFALRKNDASAYKVGIRNKAAAAAKGRLEIASRKEGGGAEGTE